MGNICCSGQPQPILVPAPRRGDPHVQPELLELRMAIDRIFHFLKTSNAFLPLSAKQVDSIKAAIDTNQQLIVKIREGLRPIDAEVQTRQIDDSQAIIKIGQEFAQELEELRQFAGFYQSQQPPANKLHADLKEIVEKCDEIIKSLDELAAKSSGFIDELGQIKQFSVPLNDLKQAATVRLLAADPIKASAQEQEVEYQVLKAKLDQFQTEDTEEVVEEMAGGGGEVVEEMEVAAEAATTFTIEELFSDISYSQWLFDHSVLRTLFNKLNKDTYRQASEQTVVDTFERIMKEKQGQNERNEREGVRPLDLDLTVVTALLGEGLDAEPREFCEFVKGVEAGKAPGNYVEVISKLLGLHETASTAPSYAALFTAVFARMETLFDSSATSQELKEGQLQDPQTGGIIPLADALTTIYQHFSTHPSLVSSWVRSLQPPSISQADYLLFLLCNRIKAINSDSNRVFKTLTSDRHVELYEFSEQLRTRFNLALTEDEFAVLFDRIDRKTTGAISRVSFISEVKLQWYFDLSKKEEFLVSKSQLLEGLLIHGREYMQSIVWETYTYAKEFQSRDLEFTTDNFSMIAAAFEVTDGSNILEKVQKMGDCVGQSVFGFDELARYALKRPFGILSSLALCK